MFGFSLKERTGEAIKRASYALLLGDYAEKNRILAMSLNEAAKPTLLFHLNANCLLVLYSAFKGSVAGDKYWATMEYFVRHVAKGFAQFEIEQAGVPQGSLLAITFPIFAALGTHQDEHDEHGIYESVREIERLDDDADGEALELFLTQNCNRYHQDVSAMFTPSS